MSRARTVSALATSTTTDNDAKHDGSPSRRPKQKAHGGADRQEGERARGHPSRQGNAAPGRRENVRATNTNHQHGMPARRATNCAAPIDSGAIAAASTPRIVAGATAGSASKFAGIDAKLIWARDRGNERRTREGSPQSAQRVHRQASRAASSPSMYAVVAQAPTTPP